MSAVFVLKHDLEIKLVNCNQICREFLDRMQPFETVFAVPFDGHLQALKVRMQSILETITGLGRSGEVFKFDNTQQMNDCLEQLEKMTQAIRFLVWYEWNYRGKLLYRFQPPKTDPKTPSKYTFEYKQVSGPFTTLDSFKVTTLAKPFYELHKEELKRKALDYYYSHQDEAKARQKIYQQKLKQKHD